MSKPPAKSPRTLKKGEWPPNYANVVMWRAWQLDEWEADLKLPEERKDGYTGPLRQNLFAMAWQFYATHPVEFINHWVDTADPRNAGNDLPSRLPLVMFEKQEEFVQMMFALLGAQESGIVDKAREMGATWVACAFSVWLWLFRDGSSIGWGSRKQELVDRLGDMSSIFEKLRSIIRNLPRIFLPPGFVYDKHLMFMRILNPKNGSSIIGEVGDEIGRGGRTTMYFTDESAHYEHPALVEAALMSNTRVRIDISTVAGIGTVYESRRNSAIEWKPGQPIKPGYVHLLVMDWSDHPMKTQEWYEREKAKKKREGLLHVFRQEVERDARASLVGVIIPADWVDAAIDAHLKLNFRPVGGYMGALDIADEGMDLNAGTIRKGVVLQWADDWSGDEESVGGSARKMLVQAQTFGPMNIQYDCVGIGVGVKSEAARLAKERKMPRGYQFVAWDAGSGVLTPKQRVEPIDKQSPTWEDFAKNLKAQGWWCLRRRFEKTYNMITQPEIYQYPFDELISLPSSLPNLAKIRRELCQPVMKFDTAMRIMIDKKPEGAKSPNFGDSIMMNYFPCKGAIVVSDEAMRWAVTGVHPAVQRVEEDQTAQFT